MKQIVNRQAVLATTWTEFAFPVKSREFCVKNLTDGDLLVSLEAGSTDDESILIKKGMGEIVYATKESTSPEAFYDKIYVKASEAGLVEVQAIDYGYASQLQASR